MLQGPHPWTCGLRMWVASRQQIFVVIARRIIAGFTRSLYSTPAYCLLPPHISFLSFILPAHSHSTAIVFSAFCERGRRSMYFFSNSSFFSCPGRFVLFLFGIYFIFFLVVLVVLSDSFQDLAPCLGISAHKFSILYKITDIWIAGTATPGLSSINIFGLPESDDLMAGLGP